jgi:hypothetical protein
MPEGLSAAEAGKELRRHAKFHAAGGQHERRGRGISIAEAILLSVVALMAAWSGYAAAKWSSQSRVTLAAASAARTNANRATLEAMELRNFDSAAFDAWFSAYTVRNTRAMRLAAHRFRREFRVAFDAWRATKPETNPDAPRGPTYMPEYRQPLLDRAKALDQRAEKASARGAEAAETSDKYVRTTVFLASVLFLVGISTHFPFLGVRHALVGLSAVLLLVSLVQITQLPGPPP